MRRRRLSSGEDALWRKVTRDIRPIKRPAKPRTPLDEPDPVIGETSREAVAPVRSRPTPTPPPARRGKGRAAPALKAGDPALDKKARRGRIGIERTLDLHGLRETAAHTRLKSFIETAARDGCLCVLVITGKGASRSDGDTGGERPRGVIRKRFEQWIDEEPLRALITRAAPAQPKDGGSGAFYVFLKGRSRNR